jgi:hypothetical protein
MHPSENAVGPAPPARILKTATQEKPYTVHQESRGQRRDPIGYFEDRKFGGSLGGQMMVNSNPAPNFNSNIMANTREPPGLVYQPSWNGNGQAGLDNGQRPANSNELFDNAMMYQQPIMANSGYDRQ